MPILSWLTRQQDVRAAKSVPYRLLQEAAELSAGDPGAGNLLIQGDNLEALKALLPFYAGQVKCIYIDPPYNTRSAFEHYDDNLEHTQWLAMMWPRLELLRDLLAEDGSIWVSIDDNEGHYLKVIMDEVFGRNCFVATNVWQKRYSRENREVIGDVHEYILVYARSVEKFKATRNLADAGRHFESKTSTSCRPITPSYPPIADIEATSVEFAFGLGTYKDRQHLHYGLAVTARLDRDQSGIGLARIQHDVEHHQFRLRLHLRGRRR